MMKKMEYYCILIKQKVPVCVCVCVCMLYDEHNNKSDRENVRSHDHPQLNHAAYHDMQS